MRMISTIMSRAMSSLDTNSKFCPFYLSSFYKPSHGNSHFIIKLGCIYSNGLTHAAMPIPWSFFLSLSLSSLSLFFFPIEKVPFFSMYFAQLGPTQGMGTFDLTQSFDDAELLVFFWASKTDGWTSSLSKLTLYPLFTIGSISKKKVCNCQCVHVVWTLVTFFV